jgi:quinoprotein dehydrogenase-associated probable ABC transporter substrate-binding protein
MSSRFPRLALALGLSLASAASPAARELRVCADPDNLPYSHADGSGFENRIATLLATELGATLRYEWQPLRRGFVRKTVGAGLCDVFIGVPSDFERVITTRAYYRSAYVFVSRTEPPLISFDDPRLAQLRVGVQLIGDDQAATPPGHALAMRGATANVEGFTIYGEGPSAQRMVTALGAGRLDAALAWGPQAGYFAARAAVPLRISPARPPPELAAMPFEFSIAVGVRRGERALRDELDAILARRRDEIDAILAAYSVPRTDR